MQTVALNPQLPSSTLWLLHPVPDLFPVAQVKWKGRYEFLQAHQ